MKTCSRCGKEVRDETVFCPFCGAYFEYGKNNEDVDPIMSYEDEYARITGKEAHVEEYADENAAEDEEHEEPEEPAEDSETDSPLASCMGFLIGSFSVILVIVVIFI